MNSMVAILSTLREQHLVKSVKMFIKYLFDGSLTLIWMPHLLKNFGYFSFNPQ